MPRRLLLAAALALAAAGPALAQATPPAPAMAAPAMAAPAMPATGAALQPGQRMQLGPMLGARTLRHVMISEGGGGIDLVYDMAEGGPQTRRVLRLENVAGMLEVIYDPASPGMATAAGGRPRLVQQGGGMYGVEYDR